MPKEFYTERDIEDMVKRGVLSLVIDDDVVLTDLARDRALRLGVELLRERPPSAPERPYLAKLDSPSASQVRPAIKSSSDDIYQQVYEATIARLGDTVDPKLLETVIRRILQNIDTK
jgi:hypothetical protein